MCFSASTPYLCLVLLKKKKMSSDPLELELEMFVGGTNTIHDMSRAESVLNH